MRILHKHHVGEQCIPTWGLRTLFCFVHAGVRWFLGWRPHVIFQSTHPALWWTDDSMKLTFLTKYRGCMYDSSQQIERRITTIATIPLLLLLLLNLGRKGVVVNLNVAFFGNWLGEGLNLPKWFLQLSFPETC